MESAALAVIRPLQLIAAVVYVYHTLYYIDKLQRNYVIHYVSKMFY